MTTCQLNVLMNSELLLGQEIFWYVLMHTSVLSAVVREANRSSYDHFGPDLNGKHPELHD
jgi:hypothetical protein